MTSLRFDAKEFVPSSTSKKCCHSDETFNRPTTSSSGSLFHANQAHQKFEEKQQSRHDRLRQRQNHARGSHRSKPKQLQTPLKGNRLAEDQKCRSGFNPRKKKEVRSRNLKRGEGNSSTVSVMVDATDRTAPCDKSESNPVICNAEFPELQPSAGIRQNKVDHTDIQSMRPNSIWSSAKSKDLARMELPVKNELLVSKGIASNERSISELIPLIQPVYTSQRNPVFDHPRISTSPTEVVPLIPELCLAQGQLQNSSPKIRKALVPFEKLRDRWWNLLLLHEQENQLLAEKEVDLVVHAHDATVRKDGDNCDRELNCESTDHVSLCNGTSSNTDKCNDPYAPKLPLHDAIYRDDSKVLKQLVSLSAVDGTQLRSCEEAEALSPLELAVKLNRPHLVRILCHALEQKECIPCKGSVKIPPLLMAAAQGHHECVLAIVSVLGSASLLTTKDVQGNTAMHYSCLSGTGCATFQSLLNFVTSSCTASFLFKLFSCRNNQEQTPLHVAAQNDRVDIIDIVLNHRNTSNVSFLSKLLTMHDLEHQTPLLAAISSGSTDVVMSFLMWRGNNCSLKRPTAFVRNSSTSLGALIANSTFCPLTWAVKCKDIDMVKLLLEFNDPSLESGYTLNDALFISVDGFSLNEGHAQDFAMLEIIRVLVEAGANPCVVDTPGSCASTRRTSPSSAIALAASQVKISCLAQLLDSYEHYLLRVRHQRRHDPRLQSQPESFFVSIETSENAKRDAALRESLTLCLSMACSSQSHDDFSSCIAYIQCCVLLYQKDTKLRLSEMQRLKESLFPHSCHGKPVEDPLSLSFKSSWNSETKMNDCPLNKMVMNLPWFDIRLFSGCDMLPRSSDTSEQKFDVEADIELVCNDGDVLLAHEIALRQSDKLAAAMRFAKLTKEQSHISGKRDLSSNQLLKVNVDLPSSLCRRLLEHIYRGSLGTGVSDSRDGFCKELLELMLVGDEYLCTSLVHECLWRLLASDNDYDQCFCAFCRKEFATNCCSSIGVDQSTAASHLISAETVLDVLAALQQISCFGRDDDCASNNGNLLTSLRERALCFALCEFGSVVKSEAFEAQFHLSVEELFFQQTDSASGMFLYMLLQDLMDLWQERS